MTLFEGESYEIKSINPYTEEVEWIYDSFSIKECRNHIEKSRDAFSGWSSLSVVERVKYFSNVGEVLRLNANNYAKIITMEMGKPIRQSRNKVQKCAWLCEYYAENAARLLKDELVDIGVEKSYVTFEPLGVIFWIMPWNVPFWQVFRFAVPAMCVGNVCVVKHASNVPRSALDIEKVFLEAGFQKHIFKTLLIDSKTAMRIITENRVNGISLTGSITAGLEIGGHL